MKYKRHFDYEVYWASVYYTFRYMKDVRRFLKDKSGYIIRKCWLEHGKVIKEDIIEISNTKNVHFSMED